MEIKTFYFNPYRVCTYVLFFDQYCIIIDPGMYTPSEENRLLHCLQKKNLQPNLVLITHTHPDHICGLPTLQQHFTSILVLGQNIENEHVDGFPFDKDDFIPIKSLPSPIFVIHTPGHKKDAVCFFFPSENALFTGDTLFNGSIGRTDLPEGNMEELQMSLSKLVDESTYAPCASFLNRDIKLLDISVYPGHGPITTIRQEIENNPFL